MNDTRGGRRLVLLDFPVLPGVRGLLARGMDHDFRRHAHGSWCLGLMDGGERILELGGRRLRAPAGSLFVVPPGAPHACRPAPDARPGDEPAYRVVSLTREALAAALAQMETGAAAPSAGVCRSPAGAAALDALFAAHAGDPLEQQEALLRLVAAVCAPGPGGQDGAAAPDPDEAEDPVVERAAAHLREHQTESVTLPELASLAAPAGIGPWTLLRRFRRRLGVTPHEYLVALRVRRAVERLRDGVAPADVAAESGFCDQSHLTRHFKRLVGLSPAAFARQQRRSE